MCNLEPGTYIVAVSGGVDSIALLHMLTQMHSLELIIAHYDHGIREDSAEDRKFVRALAEQHGLPFAYAEGKLGANASEAVARRARYDFLRSVQKKYGARAIVTAHHQDDVLETAILNMLRGTGRRGLSSLQTSARLQRPLLDISKKEILEYADQHNLQWREDSTNRDDTYRRNYVRHNIVPRLCDADRRSLLKIITTARQLNESIKEELGVYLGMQPEAKMINRHAFVMLPHTVAREVMAEWLLTHTKAELSRPMIERLVIAAKISQSGSKADIDADYWLKISRNDLALVLRER